MWWQDTYCAPLCEVPLDTTWLQAAGVNCDWLRQARTPQLVHNLHVPIAGEKTSHTPGLRAVATFCRTLHQPTHMHRLCEVLLHICTGFISFCPNFVLVCESPDSKVQCTTLTGSDMAPSRTRSLLTDAPLHRRPVGDHLHHPSGTLPSGFDCLCHILQSTED